jgi:hypothetical protein
MYKILILLILCCCFASACEEEPPAFLSNEQIEELDSLLTKAIPQERKREDSICAANFDTRLRHLVDSLLLARRAEEVRLRQIIPVQ